MRAGDLLDRLPARLAVPIRARWGSSDRELGAVKNYVEKDATVLDVGAHKGAFTWHMARLVGPGGKVHAFEPQPDLSSRLESWAPAHVVVHSCGLSDKTTTATLHVPLWGSTRVPGRASLEAAQSGVNQEIQVPVTDLDSLGLAPSFIKADVEGHELPMLRGAEATIASHRPVLLLEIDWRHSGEADSRAELLEWLRDHEYGTRYVGTNGLSAVALTERDPNEHLASKEYVYNWFCVPAEDN